MNAIVTTLDGLNWSPPVLTHGALAVWRRNFLVWRKVMGPSLLFNFGEPVLYLLGLGFGLGRFIGDMGGMPYLSFLATGLLASSAMNTSSFEGLYSVYTRMVPQRTYEGMLATPLSVDDVVGGEMLWCATKGLISSTAILVVAVAFGAVRDWQAILCLPLFILTGLCFAGPALVMSAISRSYDFFAYYVTLLITPMYIFCGVFYPADALPQAVQPLVQALPLTHAVMIIRSIASGQPPVDLLWHVCVLGAYATIGFYLAVVLVRRRLIQ